MKICSTCKQFKPLSDFNKRSVSSDGHALMCRKCTHILQRKFHESKEGIVSRIYCTQKRKSKLRGHKPPTYTKNEFREWLFNQDNFEKLYKEWVDNDYATNYTLSCDRINNTKQYSLDNIKLTSWQINNKNGCKSRMKKVHKIDNECGEIFNSIKEARLKTGINRSSIGNCCNGKTKTAGGFEWKFIE